jgi:hypothetical protein
MGIGSGRLDSRDDPDPIVMRIRPGISPLLPILSHDDVEFRLFTMVRKGKSARSRAGGGGEGSMIEVSEKNSRTISHAAVLRLNEDQETPLPLDTLNLRGWKTSLIEELNRSSARQRLSIALAGVACLNLGTFLICQVINVPGGRADLRHPLLWLLELVAILIFLRKSLGRGWIRSSPAINLVAKLWTTFLILSFNVVTLNSLTGFELAWFRPVWATLSTFLFASLAWVFSPWFFVPAVQMWATGLLMVHFPDWGFLIYGVSWWLALMGIAVQLQRKSRFKKS